LIVTTGTDWLAGDPALAAGGLAEAFAMREPLAAASARSIRVAFAPGRVNLIGEHTDYNEGFVLPAAISLGVSIAHVPTNDRRVEVTLAATGETASFDIDGLDPTSKAGGWIDYVAGTAWALTEANAPVRGFRGLLSSNLPSGVGLASSAAVELASALALSDGRMSPLEQMTVARIAQRAENAYVGVNCGLMDQFASTFGKRGHALLLDCRSLEHRAIELPLDDVALVVCYSGSPRRLEVSGYNERRSQCEAAVAAIAAHEPEVRSLRDVTPDMLEASRDRLDPLVFARAEHVVHENGRVLGAVTALRTGDLAEIGRLFAASQASMRDLFGISSPELDALVEIATSATGVIGARLTGAGFGGCTINLVRRGAADSFREAVLGEYPTRIGLIPRVFEVEPAQGAMLLDA
jgi:galactokinase